MESRRKRPVRTKSGRQPEGLAVADIIAATLALARREGFTRLSMRQIAARLGVSATALYYHFKNKNQLLSRIAGHIMESITIPDRELLWTERLRQLVLSQQRMLLAYPGLARFMVHHRESAGALRWIEMNLEVLHDAGFRDRSLTGALAILSFFVHPLTLVDDHPRPGAVQMYHGRRLASLLKNEPARYPHLQLLLPVMADASYEAYLPVALDGVIAGIAALERPGKPRR